MCSVVVISDSARSNQNWRWARTDQFPVDAKAGEFEHDLRVLGGFDLGGRVDGCHGWGGVKCGGVGQEERMTEGLYASRPCSHSVCRLSYIFTTISFHRPNCFGISPPLNTRLRSGRALRSPTQVPGSTSRCPTGNSRPCPVSSLSTRTTKRCFTGRGFHCRKPLCILAVPLTRACSCRGFVLASTPRPSGFASVFQISYLG